jgi:hypothetical protein
VRTLIPLSEFAFFLSPSFMASHSEIR